MRCPCFKDEYVGFCETSGSLHVPSITEMERHCFGRGYRFCPIFQGHAQEGRSRRSGNVPGAAHSDLWTNEEISVEEGLVAAGRHAG